MKKQSLKTPDFCGFPVRGGGFTMAEILLSLTIIGVVAAITLPSLTGNINERTWNTQRKALYSRMSQAISLMPALNSYGIGVTQEETNSNAGEVFVTNGLSKVLKINNICDNEHLPDCGIASSFTNLSGSKHSFPKTLEEMNSTFTNEFAYSGTDGTSHTFINPQAHINTNAAAFETNNGESIVVFYNPSCISDIDKTSSDYIHPYMCANFIYDLNGNKGPNTIGKDMGFMTAMYPSDTNLVAPVPLMKQDGNTYTYNEAIRQCKLQDAESRLPSRDEMTALYYNKEFIGIDFSQGNSHYWTSTKVSADKAWYLGNYNYRRNTLGIENRFRIWCIKR